MEALLGVQRTKCSERVERREPEERVHAILDETHFEVTASAIGTFKSSRMNTILERQEAKVHRSDLGGFFTYNISFVCLIYFYISAVSPFIRSTLYALQKDIDSGMPPLEATRSRSVPASSKQPLTTVCMQHAACALPNLTSASQTEPRSGRRIKTTHSSRLRSFLTTQVRPPRSGCRDRVLTGLAQS